MGRLDEVGKHETQIYERWGTTHVKFHATNVVQWDAKKIVLCHGGYETPTTKLRMNQASGQFGLGYHVYQRNFEWFVDYDGATYTFTGDTCVLVRSSRPNSIGIDEISDEDFKRVALG
jgi:hypothetical protein